MNHSHVTTALEFAGAAREMSAHLADLPADEANTWPARQMREETTHALRLAEVYAVLAVAEAIATQAGQWPPFPAFTTLGGEVVAP